MPLAYARLLRSLLPFTLLAAPLVACSHEPDGILVELAPEVVSSTDGTLHVSGLVISERTPITGETVGITVAYTDRNGDAHDIEGAEVETDGRGAFEAVVTGLDWEGTGTVTATVLSGPGGNPLTVGDEPIDGDATFAVLDRTPPTVEILPPTTDLHVGAGLPIDISVHVTDEIGISEVFLEAAGELQELRSTVVASGSGDATVTFRFEVPDNAIPGPTITLYALASDLSGNQAAAEPIVLIVDPAIVISTADPLAGQVLTAGTATFLDDPRAIALSPRDSQLYVADASGGACGGGCIRRVNPADGVVAAAVVFVGQGEIEGVAFDATGNNLYYTDRQDRVGRLTFDAASGDYLNNTMCNVVGNGNPQDPFHLVFDATLGLLVADGADQVLKRQASCTQVDPSDFGGNFDVPWGVALGAAGEIYVSDQQRDEIYVVDRTTGNASVFEDDNLDKPRGVEWMAGGVSQFADTLLVANTDDRTVISTSGPNTTRAAVYLRPRPIDVAVDGTTAYILAEPRNNDPGRIFVVTGF